MPNLTALVPTSTFYRFVLFLKANTNIAVWIGINIRNTKSRNFCRLDILFNKPVRCNVPVLKECMTILNGYYLPNGGDKQLYNVITPVNTFRVIFNHYFNADYPLLKDENFFSTASHPYKFINVTDEMKEN